jgi:hypothetical protein
MNTRKLAGNDLPKQAIKLDNNKQGDILRERTYWVYFKVPLLIYRKTQQESIETPGCTEANP